MKHSNITTIAGGVLSEKLKSHKGSGSFIPSLHMNLVSKLSTLFLIAALVLPFVHVTHTTAQGAPFIRFVRKMEVDETGFAHPAGLAFSNRGNAFQVISAVQSVPGATDSARLSALAVKGSSRRLPLSVENPINVSFDNKFNRLLFLPGQANQLVAVQADGAGNPDPRAATRYDARGFGVQNPQGLTTDEQSGTLYILDAHGPKIIRVTPAADGDFNAAAVTQIDLQPLGVSNLRGIAFNPSSGSLFVVDPTAQKLYELTQSGQLLTTRDLSQFHINNPQTLLFAPSGDQTDDPAQMSLYVADSGSTDVQSNVAAPQDAGQVIELSLSALAAPAAASYSVSLIRTTDMAALSPPSPDASGIGYLPNSNTLLVVDGEVEEIVKQITHFQGANVWELTLQGGLVRTANISKLAPTVTPMTNEPTDVAWNPANNHYYVSDDNALRVYDLNPGGDGLVGTADDTWTYFKTDGVGNGDPEGITFNTWNNHIFVADGLNAEIYEYTIAGALINHFDVQGFGVQDPEGVEFDAETGSLFVLSSNLVTPVIVETTTSGDLLQTIDISVIGARAAAGLAFAPASNGSGARRFYIVDRGIDNNNDPNIIDGKMYEVSAPASALPTATPSNTPTNTSTSTPTRTPTNTPTITPTNTPTKTPTSTPTNTPAGPPNDKDTVGVFRPSNGLIYLKNSNTTGYADIAINYGIGGDYPIAGDWDGNGTDTIGVYRNGIFYLRNSNSVGNADIYFSFGAPGDQPIAGDWDGDGIDTIGVYRSSTFTFFLRNSNTAGPPDYVFQLGMPGDIGIAGDWTGKGYDTVGVFRPSNGVIFLKNTNQTGYADIAINFGIGGDKPVTGDWDNNGTDTIGVLRGNTFYLRNSNTVGNADVSFALGLPGDMPIAGNWDGKP